MPRQSSTLTDSSPQDSPTTEDWDNSIETQAHRLERNMSNRNFDKDVRGNTASSSVIKSRPTPSKIQYPVIIGGRSCFKTAAHVQNFCQLPDPPPVDIAIEAGIDDQTPTFKSASPQSRTHTIACVSSASSRHIEDRSYHEKISILFKEELRNALLPLAIKPPPFSNRESQQASQMKFKGKTRADDTDDLWEAAVRSQTPEKPEVPHGLIVLGEGSKFKTAQGLADYFAWLGIPPVYEVLNVAHTKRFMVCEISAANTNTIQDVLLYKYIAVEFRGESINALLPQMISPAWQVAPKPPITLGDVSARRSGTSRSSPMNQDHPSSDVTIDLISTRPEGLYPLIIRNPPGEEDILNSSASSRSVVVYTCETTAYPQPRPAVARAFNRDPVMRFYPSTPIVYVTRDVRRRLEARSPGVSEVVWLKEHPMFAWRSFDHEFNLDWEKCIAELARESNGQYDKAGVGRSSLRRQENYGSKSTDTADVSSTIGWPRTERNPLGRTEPMTAGSSSRAHDGQSPFDPETTLSDIRRNKRILLATKDIDKFVAAGPRTGTDTIDWAERAASRQQRVDNEVNEASEVNKVSEITEVGEEADEEAGEEASEEVAEEVKAEEKNLTDEKTKKTKKSGSFRSGIKKLFGFGRRK